VSGMRHKFREPVVTKKPQNKPRPEGEPKDYVATALQENERLRQIKKRESEIARAQDLADRQERIARKMRGRNEKDILIRPRLK